MRAPCAPRRQTAPWRFWRRSPSGPAPQHRGADRRAWSMSRGPRQSSSEWFRAAARCGGSRTSRRASRRDGRESAAGSWLRPAARRCVERPPTPRPSSALALRFRSTMTMVATAFQRTSDSGSTIDVMMSLTVAVGLNWGCGAGSSRLLQPSAARTKTPRALSMTAFVNGDMAGKDSVFSNYSGACAVSNADPFVGRASQARRLIL